jgi:hypothetical protein
MPEGAPLCCDFGGGQLWLVALSNVQTGCPKGRQILRVTVGVLADESPLTLFILEGGVPTEVREERVQHRDHEMPAGRKNASELSDRTIKVCDVRKRQPAGDEVELFVFSRDVPQVRVAKNSAGHQASCPVQHLRRDVDPNDAMAEVDEVASVPASPTGGIERSSRREGIDE